MNLRKGDVVRLKPNPNNEDYGDMFVEKVTVTVRGKEDGIVRDFKLSSLERGDQVSIRCMDTKDVLPHLNKIIDEYDYKDSAFTIAAIKELYESIKYSVENYERRNKEDSMPFDDVLRSNHGIDAVEDIMYFRKKMAEEQSDGDKEKYQKILRMMEDSIILQNIERAKL